MYNFGTYFLSGATDVEYKDGLFNPPKDWKQANIELAKRVANVANDMLAKARGDRFDKVAGLRLSLDSALAQLPAGDGVKWGRNLIQRLDAELSALKQESDRRKIDAEREQRLLAEANKVVVKQPVVVAQQNGKIVAIQMTPEQIAAATTAAKLDYDRMFDVVAYKLRDMTKRGWSIPVAWEGTDVDHILQAVSSNDRSLNIPKKMLVDIHEELAKEEQILNKNQSRASASAAQSVDLSVPNGNSPIAPAPSTYVVSAPAIQAPAPVPAITASAPQPSPAPDNIKRLHNNIKAAYQRILSKYPNWNLDTSTFIEKDDRPLVLALINDGQVSVTESKLIELTSKFFSEERRLADQVCPEGMMFNPAYPGTRSAPVERCISASDFFGGGIPGATSPGWGINIPKPPVKIYDPKPPVKIYDPANPEGKQSFNIVQFAKDNALILGGAGALGLLLLLRR